MNEKICPQCGAPKMKNWNELTEEQKFLVERLPASADHAPDQRKKHRFCERCFYEEISRETRA